MLNALFSSPKVAVSLEEDQLFVHPVDSDYPTPDPVLKGTVLLNLPSKRAISRFKVVLEGLCDISPGAGHQAYESSTTIRKELVTEFGGEEFDAGAHHFNFAFIIPSSTAVYQRSTHGRVRHWVKATVDFEGMLYPSASSAPTALWITANPSPPGELPLPTDVAYQHFSPDLGPVGIHVSSPHFTVAALCNIRLSLLGAPKAVTVTSIKGFVIQAFDLTLENGKSVKPKPSKFELVKVDGAANPCPKAPPLTMPPAAFHRDSISSSSNTFSSLGTPPLTPTSTFSSSSTFSSGFFNSASSSPASSSSYPNTPSQPAALASPASAYPCSRPSKLLFTAPGDKLVADPFPLATVEAATEYHYSRICRVPDDDHVRPSTLDASEGRIRVSHMLSVEIRYKTVERDEEKVLTISKPITIASCCCLLDKLYLPAYSQRAPKTILKSTPQSCMCTVSLKEAFDRDGEALQRAGEIEPVREGGLPRLIGVCGQEIDRYAKSPAYTPERHEVGLPTPTMEELEFSLNAVSDEKS
ncbi:uncharacterized protein JCM15063_006370 [Sporobolomyces koalae]|uniref:uncharacterized protein n=1 Tax=Sporobolomyces koalae TaxID=500713 RepID=UPI00316F725E